MKFQLWPVVGLVLAFAMASPASANSRDPATFKLVFRPGSNTEMVLGTTFGFLISKDDGATWRWGCDSVVGIQGTYDPDYEITPTGLLLGTSYTGIYMTRDGCHWTHPPGPVGTSTISSIAVASTGVIWTTMADPVAGYKIFKSVDDGASFQEITGLPQTDWWDMIEVAPSDPNRLYLTGFRFEGAAGIKTRILVRSSNGGQTWEELPTTAFVGTNNSDLHIAAISPSDPDLVFMRLTLTGPTLQERIYRSTNAGAALPTGPTWTQVLEAGDYLISTAIRSNGDVYIVSTMLQKLYKSTGGGAFAEVPGVTYRSPCVIERPGDHALFLCMSNQLTAGEPLTFLARSTTGAAGTWTRVLRFVDITGPIRCEAGTLQHDDCEVNLWCGQKDQLGATSNEIDCSTPVDAGIDAATPPGGGGGKGCCDAGGAPGLEAAPAAVLLLLRRRRRPKVVA